MLVPEWMRGSVLLLAADKGGDGGGGGGGDGGGSDGEKGSDGDAAPNGLLDDVPDEGDDKPAPRGKMGSSTADDGGGDGEDPDPDPDAPYRPEGLQDSELGENDRETIDKLLARNKGLRQKLSKGGAKPPEKPEDYKLAAPEGVEIDLQTEGNQAVQAMFAGVAHKHGLDPDLANGLFGDLLQGIVTLPGMDEPAPPPDLTQEWQQLGGKDKGMKLAQGVLGWGRSLVSQGVLSKDDMDEFRIMGGTAKGLKILSRLRDLSGEKPIPIEMDPGGDSLPSRQDLRAMQADPRYETDVAYRQKVDREYERVFGKT